MSLEGVDLPKHFWARLTFKTGGASLAAQFEQYFVSQAKISEPFALPAEAVQAVVAWGSSLSVVLLVIRSFNESRSSAHERGTVQALLSVPNNRASPSGQQHYP